MFAPQHHRTLTLALSLATMMSGCGFFHDDDDSDGRHGQHDYDEDFDEDFDEDEDFPHLPFCPADAGTTTGDAQTPVPDAGSGLVCTSNQGCPRGSVCQAGQCAACPDGQCACRRDTDCGGTDVCDRAAGLCIPEPLTCADVTGERACLARPDCQAVYGGVNCRDAQGGECTSSDPDCTCESFSFATCASR